MTAPGAGSLFVETKGRIGVSLFGLLAQAAHNNFHVVAGEKRGVPFLNKAYGSGENAPEEYTLNATYEGRIAEARLLLDTLLKQPKSIPRVWFLSATPKAPMWPPRWRPGSTRDTCGLLGRWRSDTDVRP